MTGTVAKVRDALSRETKFFYDDSFATYNASGTETTPTPLPPQSYAYPTKITDPGNNFATMKYWYDTGAVTRTTDPKSASSINVYDFVYGRLERAKNLENSAYTRYVYATDHNSVQSLTTVNDTNIETSSIAMLDGVGRARVNVNEHPDSTGGLSLNYKVFDLMGRVVEWSNPAEVYGQAGCGTVINGVQQTACWALYGDDVSGFKYSRQDYDWKGRPTITYNQDYNATTNPNSKRQISYDGCGCTGAQVTTVTDEMGRMQKAYSDVFGRTFKTELYNGTAIYSTQLITFNIRDQVTQSSLLAGTNGTSQNVTSSYDGYGRLWKQKNPLQTTDTVYEYFNDDQLMRVTDARGAATNFAYNNPRGLLSDISYSVPQNNPASTDPLYVAPTSPVNFTYDAAGNRLTMTDGIGAVNYAYDTLSRMTSETRTITEINKTYKLVYDYNLAGQVKQVGFESLSFPTENLTTNYQFDKTGRLTGITGNPDSNGNTQYAGQVKYRAFDAVKSLTYGNSHNLNSVYNSRLQLQSLNVAKTNGTQISNKEYYYYNDNHIKYAKDNLFPGFDRAYQYDYAGRLTESWTAFQAQNFFNGQPIGTGTTPYHQAFTYDVWGNRLTNTGNIWGNAVTETETYNAQTLRHDGWTYNNAGQVISDSLNQLKYDVAGRNISVINGPSIATQAHDGDGQIVRRDPNTNVPKFLINSSVLGGKTIAEVIGIDGGLGGNNILAKGRRLDSYVYFGETRIASQLFSYTGPANWVSLQHLDPLTGAKIEFSAADPQVGRSEPDSMAINVDLVDPATVPPQIEPEDPGEPAYCLACGAPPGPSGYNPNEPVYYVDGIRRPERFALHLLSINSATLDPKYVHDVGTLHRAGILGHWERKFVPRGTTSNAMSEGTSFSTGNGYDVVRSYVIEGVRWGGMFALGATNKGQSGSSSSGKTKQNEALPPQTDGKTCILEIRGKEIGATKGWPVVGIHTYSLTYTPGNEDNKTYFGAFNFNDELGSKYGAYTEAVASTDFTDPYKWSVKFETASPCSDVNAGFKVVSDKLNGSHVPYRTWPTVSKEATLNSNSFTYTALRYIYSPEVFAEIDKDIRMKEKLYYTTPGWGNVLPLNLPPRK